MKIELTIPIGRMNTTDDPFEFLNILSVFLNTNLEQYGLVVALDSAETPNDEYVKKYNRKGLK